MKHCELRSNDELLLPNTKQSKSLLEGYQIDFVSISFHLAVSFCISNEFK